MEIFYKRLNKIIISINILENRNIFTKGYYFYRRTLFLPKDIIFTKGHYFYQRTLFLPKDIIFTKGHYFYQIVSVDSQYILSPFFTLYKLLNNSKRAKGQFVLYLSIGCGFVFNCALTASSNIFCLAWTAK